MMIVKINSNTSGQHLFQSQSHRKSCWLDGYIEVPLKYEGVINDCAGYCDLVIANDVLTNVIAKPDLIPIEETKPSDVEQLRADIDYIAIMTGVEL